MKLESLWQRSHNFMHSHGSRQHYRLVNFPLQESTCSVGVTLHTNLWTSHFTDNLFLSRNIITFNKINIKIVLLEGLSKYMLYLKIVMINISHKSCSDGVNKKLPSEISVKPDLTKDLKENKQTDTHKERHTHTEQTLC